MWYWPVLVHHKVKNDFTCIIYHIFPVYDLCDISYMTRIWPVWYIIYDLFRTCIIYYIWPVWMAWYIIYDLFMTCMKYYIWPFTCIWPVWYIIYDLYMTSMIYYIWPVYDDHPSHSTLEHCLRLFWKQLFIFLQPVSL